MRSCTFEHFLNNNKDKQILDWRLLFVAVLFCSTVRRWQRRIGREALSICLVCERGHAMCSSALMFLWLVQTSNWRQRRLPCHLMSGTELLYYREQPLVNGVVQFRTLGGVDSTVPCKLARTYILFRPEAEGRTEPYQTFSPICPMRK
jgi:hypothetical protein